jgi:hypothetical protein
MREAAKQPTFDADELLSLIANVARTQPELTVKARPDFHAVDLTDQSGFAIRTFHVNRNQINVAYDQIYQLLDVDVVDCTPTETEALRTWMAHHRGQPFWEIIEDDPILQKINEVASTQNIDRVAVATLSSIRNGKNRRVRIYNERGDKFEAIYHDGDTLQNAIKAARGLIMFDNNTDNGARALTNLAHLIRFLKDLEEIHSAKNALPNYKNNPIYGSW